jgi:hypothetical protein
LIRDALDQNRTEEEGEEWLWEKSQKAAVVAKLVHCGREEF